MKVLIGVFVFLTVITAPTLVQADAPHSRQPEADYQSGLKWGVHDAESSGKSNTPDIYLFQPDHGFINQTREFINGYVIGFCSKKGPNAYVDEPEGDFNCTQGPSSAGWMVGKTITGTYTSKFNGTSIHQRP